VLNPVLGKSLVVYAGKPAPAATGDEPARRTDTTRGTRNQKEVADAA